MPELPEVELARRNLVRWFRGRMVVGTEADDTRIFRGARRAYFSSVRGRLLRAARKGKYLLLSFENGGGVLAHFGMTGKLVRRPKGHCERYSRARFLLDDNAVIHFRDPRMFGRIQPVRADQLWRIDAIRQLGRDPLLEGLTPAQLKAALGPSRQPIKVALMDQRRLAGLGNIHAAEALFRARVHPGRKPTSLKPEEWDRLCHGIHSAIRFALAREDGDEIEYVEEGEVGNPFRVYGREGEPCRRCRSRIRAIAQGGRTTYFCPKCQAKKDAA